MAEGWGLEQARSPVYPLIAHSCKQVLLIFNSLLHKFFSQLSRKLVPAVSAIGVKGDYNDVSLMLQYKNVKGRY